VAQKHGCSCTQLRKLNSIERRSPTGHDATLQLATKLFSSDKLELIGGQAFAQWVNGKLVRSLSLSPDSGILEDIGPRFPFEEPFWSGGARGIIPGCDRPAAKRNGACGHRSYDRSGMGFVLKQERVG